ncbi:hypothetical protein M422DRAFT_781216 [Sphaerobolus stellatus SS14]|uniref:Uncharacterized protein n=1 Tax=Sphaerobolus stellatus (strain SS14) TaxID=990650 RepID=A0A0C9VMK4_SPHS4|nr:hypothetical protein M422DRAFT_781216 [Sphaerobolus stellatus SS14]
MAQIPGRSYYTYPQLTLRTLYSLKERHSGNRSYHLKTVHAELEHLIKCEPLNLGPNWKKKVTAACKELEDIGIVTRANGRISLSEKAKKRISDAVKQFGNFNQLSSFKRGQFFKFVQGGSIKRASRTQSKRITVKEFNALQRERDELLATITRLEVEKEQLAQQPQLADHAQVTMQAVPGVPEAQAGPMDDVMSDTTDGNDDNEELEQLQDTSMDIPDHGQVRFVSEVPEAQAGIAGPSDMDHAMNDTTDDSDDMQIEDLPQSEPFDAYGSNLPATTRVHLQTPPPSSSPTPPTRQAGPETPFNTIINHRTPQPPRQRPLIRITSASGSFINDVSRRPTPPPSSRHSPSPAGQSSGQLDLEKEHQRTNAQPPSPSLQTISDLQKKLDDTNTERAKEVEATQARIAHLQRLVFQRSNELQVMKIANKDLKHSLNAANNEVELIGDTTMRRQEKEMKKIKEQCEKDVAEAKASLAKAQQDAAEAVAAVQKFNAVFKGLVATSDDTIATLTGSQSAPLPKQFSRPRDSGIGMADGTEMTSSDM